MGKTSQHGIQNFAGILRPAQPVKGLDRKIGECGGGPAIFVNLESIVSIGLRRISPAAGCGQIIVTSDGQNAVLPDCGFPPCACISPLLRRFTGYRQGDRQAAAAGIPGIRNCIPDDATGRAYCIQSTRPEPSFARAVATGISSQSHPYPVALRQGIGPATDGFEF